MDIPSTLPSLFLSHGSPLLALEDSATGRFLDGLGQQLPRPRAILVASAHFMRREPTVTLSAQPGTVHDFSGFPAELHAMRYPAPGDPALARRVAALLERTAITARVDPQAGLDHGVWVPLHRMYPQADIPVVALSVNPHGSAADHYRTGLALQPLRSEGVLVIGSGGFSHNLRALDWQHPHAPASPAVERFTTALRDHLLRGDVDAALEWHSLSDALTNHPSSEHLYPLYVALGAAGQQARARTLHRAVEFGALALDAFAFE